MFTYVNHVTPFLSVTSFPWRLPGPGNLFKDVGEGQAIPAASPEPGVMVMVSDTTYGAMDVAMDT